jgi:hypothetical protein
MRRPSIRSLVGGAAGILAGAAAGIALGSITAASDPAATRPKLIDAAHVPPLLTRPGEPITLRFALVCSPRDDGEPCDGSGEVYARAGQTGPFRRLVVRRGDSSLYGRYFVELPNDIAASPAGFSYYAVLRDDRSGASITVPSGGAAAPHRSFPLAHAPDVDVGAHVFGHIRRPNARIVDANWGSAVGDLGLAGSRELGFVGPTSFDVTPDGAVTVLDQVNGRVQRWFGRGTKATPLDVGGGLADLAVEPDGTIAVLEPPNRATPAPLLRRFRPDGTPLWAQRLSDRTWAKLVVGPDGPVVLQEPSEQWLPVTNHDGAPLGRGNQAERGRPGRPLANRREVLVQRVGAGELRVAEVARDRLVRGWRITSATALGEVQLAEPVGRRLVVVVKAYSDDRDEFVVLVLDDERIAEQFSVETAQWAESAPLARFRLSGTGLYHLGSTPTGAFVDRFDLEATP